MEKEMTAREMARKSVEMRFKGMTKEEISAHMSKVRSNRKFPKKPLDNRS